MGVESEETSGGIRTDCGADTEAKTMGGQADPS
jgi:hypothetical protein